MRVFLHILEIPFRHHYLKKKFYYVIIIIVITYKNCIPEKPCLCALIVMARWDYVRSISDAFDSDNPYSTGQPRLMNILMQLRKCVNHPYLFDGILLLIGMCEPSIPLWWYFITYWHVLTIHTTLMAFYYLSACVNHTYLWWYKFLHDGPIELPLLANALQLV